MVVERATTPVLTPEASAGLALDESASLAPLTDVPLEVSIRLGRTRLTLGELMSLKAGAVLGLEREVNDPAEIMVGDKVVALGQMVMLGEELGVRVVEVADGARSR
jgi:flagellar motor switch protein FliN/FliY